MKVVGYARLKGSTLYFDRAGWDLVKKTAYKQHKSPKVVVIAGLKRGMKLEKAKKSRT